MSFYLYSDTEYGINIKRHIGDWSLDSEYVAHQDNTAFFPEKIMSSTDLKGLIAVAEAAEEAAIGARQH